MSGNGNQVPLAPNQRGPGAYPRAPTPHRADCFHPSGASGAGYMQAGNPGSGQNNAQPPVRVPPSQNAAPPQQQQDLAKSSMAHNFVPGQNQSQQPRPQYTNFSYGATQHGARPATHPRQQQRMYTGTGVTGSGPLMYSTVLYQPPMGIQQPYQQTRPQGYFQIMTSPYIGYSAPNPTQQYFITPPNLATAPGRNNPTAMVGPQGTQTTPSAPNNVIPHPGQTPAHMMSTIPVPRTQVDKRKSHKIPILHPVTHQDIFSSSFESPQGSGESSERQTPQPESAPPINSIAEEFTRMVNEKAKEPSIQECAKTKINIKNTEQNSNINTASSKTNIISVNNTIKTDAPSPDNKNYTTDVIVEPSETPVVSAMTNSPVIVPKLPSKQLKAVPEPSLVDANKNKQQKVVKSDVEIASNEKDVEPEVSARDSHNAQEKSPALVQQKSEQEPKPAQSMLNADTEPFIASAPITESTTLNSIQEINSFTSQPSVQSLDTLETIKQSTENETLNTVISSNPIEVPENKDTSALVQSSTELQAVSVDIVPIDVTNLTDQQSKDATSAIEAQVKLNQNIASCIRSPSVDNIMKDINSNKTPVVESTNEMSNANNNDEITEKKIPINLNNKSANNNHLDTENALLNTNEEDETDHINTMAQEKIEAPTAAELSLPVLKYKYNDDQWSPLNTAGRKYYDIDFLKQLRDDPMCKVKPDVPLLETCNILKEPQTFIAPLPRPINDSLFPPFLKNAGAIRNMARDPKKDGRVMPTGKSSVSMAPNPGSSGPHKPVIHLSLSLGDVKLNEVKNAWKPNRLKKDNTDEDEKSEDLYKKFRGILNKLTPQKFDTLMEKVKKLDIATESQLKGVIDLVFEKAIDEPNFSKAYATMCDKLSKIVVPSDVARDKSVNFKGLIISKCQNQFLANKVDESIMQMQKEASECQDPAKKKELLLQIDEENRRLRMRSVGNVRFIGELYKLKMLNSKIMVFCMNELIKHIEEEKLECLCKLLTTIGEQVENEVKDQLDLVFKKMQDIVDRKHNKVSSRVRFMLQDVIELRRRRWVQKSVVDLQPKMMDQIQREAEQQQRNIEIMNSAPMSSSNFRRDDNRGKRGHNGRHGSGGGGGGGGGNNMFDNTWKTTTKNVDTSKLRAASSSTNKNICNVKLAPYTTWNNFPSAKTAAQLSSNSLISLPTTTTNKFSVLSDNFAADPDAIRGNKETTGPSYHSKGASIERSTFNSRSDLPNANSQRVGSMGVSRVHSGSRSTSGAMPAAVSAPADEVMAPNVSSAPVQVPQEPLPDQKRNSVKSTFELYIVNRANEKAVFEEAVADIEQLFPPQYHAGLIAEVLTIGIEKSLKDFEVINRTVQHLVTMNIISKENLGAGIREVLEIASDLFIDIPMLYDYLAKFIAPHIEKKNITLVDVFRYSEPLIEAGHGSIFLKHLIKELKDSMGPTFVKSKWQESELKIKQWMHENQVLKFIEDNKLEFLEGDAMASEETKKIWSPAETTSKLLQLMNSDESCECIRGWVKDNLDKASNEDWFMRSLIQAICEHALFGPEARKEAHFKQERMNKYCSLICEFGESKQARESSCLFGIQQLLHNLEHPLGVTLEIFQFLHEQYIISVEGFTAWEVSEVELEGKAVLLKTLTSFFTSIKETDNEDSCSEG